MLSKLSVCSDVGLNTYHSGIFSKHLKINCSQQFTDTSFIFKKFLSIHVNHQIASTRKIDENDTVVFFVRDLRVCRASRDDYHFAATRIVDLCLLVIVIDDKSKESGEPIGGEVETIVEVLRVKLINITSKKPRRRE